MKVITKRYKNGFFVDLVEYYDEFYQNGWYTNSEIETQDWVIDHAQPEWVSLDIGAHIGYYSMLLAHLAPKGKVWAFEVCFETVNKMVANIDYNQEHHGRDFSNINITQVALGDKAGGRVETVWQTGMTPGNYGETTRLFAFDTIDHYFKDIRLSRLDFIKIDADGWDFDIVVGGLATIRKFRPIINMETNALGWRNHSSDEFYKLVAMLDYDPRPMDGINTILIPR
jgi:FkbM family methyltransferase